MTQARPKPFRSGDISGLLFAFFLLIYCLKGPRPASNRAFGATVPQAPKGALLYSSYLIFRRQNPFVNLFPGKSSPHRNGLALGHFFIIMFRLLCKKNWK
jgi:hypothetical protein